MTCRLTATRTADERHSGLYVALCDAVAPQQDQTTTEDFCEQCRPAFLRLDAERNAELVARKEMWFRLGMEVARRTGATLTAPTERAIDEQRSVDEELRDSAAIVGAYNALDGIDVSRPVLE